MRLERWLHEWDALLIILAVGLLTGLITFMATDTHPAACLRMVNTTVAGKFHVPARSLTWVCGHP